MEDKQEMELVAFYKLLIKHVTNKEVEVSVDEISEGKYGVEIIVVRKYIWNNSVFLKSCSIKNNPKDIFIVHV